MTPKQDATVGPEAGPDELDPRRIVGKPGDPPMTPPEDRKTDPDLKPLTRGIFRDLFEEWMTPISRRLDKQDQVLANLERVLVGPVDEQGKPQLDEIGFPVGGIGRAMHTTNGHLSVIKSNTDARQLADRLFELFQNEYRRELDVVHRRLDELEAKRSGPNGAHEPGV